MRKYRRLIAKYGEDPFPDLTRQAEAIMKAVHREHDRSILTEEQSRKEFDYFEREERELLVRAEMERFIFGRVWSETQDELAAARGRIDALLGQAREERRRAEERRIQEEERRLAKEARRREQEEEQRREEEKRAA